MTFSLLDNEQLVQQSPNQVVSLTTHRIRLQRSNSADSYIVSILLE